MHGMAADTLFLYCGGVSGGWYGTGTGAVSTQSEENAPEISEDAVWLNKNATGSLGVTMKMPQLYYTAEEGRGTKSGYMG